MILLIFNEIKRNSISRTTEPCWIVGLSNELKKCFYICEYHLIHCESIASYKATTKKTYVASFPITVALAKFLFSLSKYCKIKTKKTYLKRNHWMYRQAHKKACTLLTMLAVHSFPHKSDQTLLVLLLTVVYMLMVCIQKESLNFYTDSNGFFYFFFLFLFESLLMTSKMESKDL